jgi:hypothetical protein
VLYQGWKLSVSAKTFSPCFICGSTIDIEAGCHLCVGWGMPRVQF